MIFWKVADIYSQFFFNTNLILLMIIKIFDITELESKSFGVS